MIDDVNDKRSTVEWLKDEISQGRWSILDHVTESSRSYRIPAGFRVLLSLLPLVMFLVVLLFIFMVRLDDLAGLSGVTSLPPSLSEADREFLHSNPELFLYQNSSYTLENGTVLYTIEPDVMQMWVLEIAESKKVYTLLSYLLVLLVGIFSFRLVIVVVWCLFALLDRPCPRWLDSLV